MLANKVKIDVTKLRPIPVHLGQEDTSGSGFGLCVFGNGDHLKEWVDQWGFKLEESGKFTNIIIPNHYNISECFHQREPFKYVDGFSPNLNKHLHLGHLSNLTLAKAFQAMDLGENFIAILGDTLDGDVPQGEAMAKYREYCSVYNYQVTDIYYASQMKCKTENLVDGKNKYEGTKVFILEDGQKIVGLKADGSTTYFYQDVALAQQLDDTTLYMTGSEQKGHFESLNKMYPKVSHIGLGLVTLDRQKQSTRKQNVIYASEVLGMLEEKFDNNKQLAYNVLAGVILKSAPKSTKDINVELIDNPKNSPGLYFSYTAARLKSAGVIWEVSEKFNSLELQFASIKARETMSPNVLLEALERHCRMINSMYIEHRIEGNERHRAMFANFLEDLELGMNRLGMFSIERV